MLKSSFNGEKPSSRRTGMPLKLLVFPFLLSLGGVMSDYISTIIGLSMGFYETHLQYSPVRALLVYWGALTILSFTPHKNLRTLSANALALTSYLGVINNVLVILGVFSGVGI